MAKIINVVPRCLRFEETPWEGTGFGLHGCRDPSCSHGPLFQPDCLTSCWRVLLVPAFGFFLNTALQVPLFWLSFILQRLVKTNLLRKASPTPHSLSLSFLQTLSHSLPVPCIGQSFFGVWYLLCPCASSVSAAGRKGLGAPSGWGQCLGQSPLRDLIQCLGGKKCC